MVYLGKLVCIWIIVKRENAGSQTSLLIFYEMKKVVPVLMLIALVLCSVIGWLGYQVLNKYFPTKEKSNLEDFYGVSANEVALFLNSDLQEAKGILHDDQVYLPVSWVSQNLNERFYWDSYEQILVYALPESVVYADIQTKSSNGKSLLWMNDNGEIYLSKELAASYTNMRMDYFIGEGFKRLFIDTNWGAEQWTLLKRNGSVREKGGMKSPIVVKKEKGELVKVLSSMDYWAKVRTEDGYVGYLEKFRLGKEEEQIFTSTFEEPIYENCLLDEKVCLAWHQVTSMEGNAGIQRLIRNTKGVNVVSPTWFALLDNDGNYSSLADRSYVDFLHSQGIQVWALIDNFNNSVQSEVLFARTSVRRKLIEHLMQDVETYALDGLNLDIESLKESAGVHYLQFIRELSVDCRKKKIVLSIDNHVPAAYNAFYNRKEQGIVADYVIIMGYDEHYAGGDEGPVASCPYVEKGIQAVLEEVPKEKVINAIPFYTRVWKVDNSQTSSDAMGIVDAKEWVRANNVSLQWKEDLGLYYGEKVSKDETKKIWLEEEKSIGLKMNLIRDYGLAGVACWKLGFEPSGIWEIVKIN